MKKDLNLERMEKKYIAMALERNGFHRGKAAEDLGISLRTMYRKINKYFPELKTRH